MESWVIIINNAENAFSADFCCQLLPNLTFNTLLWSFAWLELSAREFPPSFPVAITTLSCKYFFFVGFWICAENDCSAYCYLFHTVTQIFLNILNIQNLITSLNAKVCKKSVARDFLPEEVHHLLIKIVSTIVFAIISGKTGTDYYFQHTIKSLLYGIIISVFSFTENLCFLNLPGIPLPS